MKLFGRFRIQVKDTITGKDTDTGWIDNLVLNNTFTQLRLPVSNYSWIIQLGTGTTPPTLADTSLETWLYSKGVSGGWDGGGAAFNDPIYSTSGILSQEYALGEVVGNISEIGLSNTSSSTGNLHTRALITDGAGDPTTITLTSTDILKVTYEVGYEIDTSFDAGAVTVDFDGQSVDLTAKWLSLGKGGANGNGMNNQILPYMTTSWTQQWVTVYSTLPTDPLNTGTAGGVTLYKAKQGGNWSANYSASGSSWIKYITFTLPTGTATGDWVGIGIGGGTNQGIVLFEFSEPVTKTDLQEFKIVLRFQIQRDAT